MDHNTPPCKLDAIFTENVCNLNHLGVSLMPALLESLRDVHGRKEIPLIDKDASKHDWDYNKAPDPCAELRAELAQERRFNEQLIASLADLDRQKADWKKQNQKGSTE